MLLTPLLPIGGERNDYCLHKVLNTIKDFALRETGNGFIRHSEHPVGPRHHFHRQPHLSPCFTHTDSAIRMPSPPLGNISINIHSLRPNFSLSSWKSLPRPVAGESGPTSLRGSCWHTLPYSVCRCALLCLLIYFFSRTCSCPPPMAGIHDFLLFGSLPSPTQPGAPSRQACQRGSTYHQGGGHPSQDQSQVPPFRIASVWLRKQLREAQGQWSW